MVEPNDPKEKVDKVIEEQKKQLEKYISPSSPLKEELFEPLREKPFSYKERMEEKLKERESVRNKSK